jgi:hypothetical protein
MPRFRMWGAAGGRARAVVEALVRTHGARECGRGRRVLRVAAIEAGARGTPARAAGIQARHTCGSLYCLEVGRHTFRIQTERPGQPLTYEADWRLGRVRPAATCLAYQRSTSERSQSFERPRPRSMTGLGMSSYLAWYSLTVLRWDRPRRRATSCVSMRLSTSTLRPT